MSYGRDRDVVLSEISLRGDTLDCSRYIIVIQPGGQCFTVCLCYLKEQIDKIGRLVNSGIHEHFTGIHQVLTFRPVAEPFLATFCTRMLNSHTTNNLSYVLTITDLQDSCIIADQPITDQVRSLSYKPYFFIYQVYTLIRAILTYCSHFDLC